MSHTDVIVTWALAADRDGAPLILAAEPNAEETRDALALVRLNPAAKRYSVEPVGVTDHGFAARLAREAVAQAFQGGADWTRVRPADLAPSEPAEEPRPERIDRGAVRPGHPAFKSMFEETLSVGLAMYPPEEREAARRRLTDLALAQGLSVAEIGRSILRERAEAADRLHISALHAPDLRDPVALAAGHDDSADVWSRVTRPPQPGETTIATRLQTGF